jgi:hypothetical protein
VICMTRSRVGSSSVISRLLPDDRDPAHGAQ